MGRRPAKVGIPPFEDLEGIVIKVLNKYRSILRTKNEIEDLKQDAYITYENVKGMALRKYGEDIRNFPSLFYGAWKWDVARMIDTKMLLVKKPGSAKDETSGEKTNAEKKRIGTYDSNQQALEEDHSSLDDFIYIENKELIDKILDGLNDVETFIIKRNFGIECDRPYNLVEISKALDMKLSFVRSKKSKILRKLKEEYGGINDVK